MEFLRGRSLAARMTVEPPLSLVQKLDILTQLCTGLHYAHEQGIVHRDVKPANIWVMDDGTIKLLDFGIAKIAASTMTSSGNVLGSAAYMAPEQVSGREIDGRADVFAAGVVLYELLARRKPFEGDAPTAVMMKIIKEDPPPIRNFAPDIPVSLVNAVNKALQKDPDKRFMHAGDFGVGAAADPPGARAHLGNAEGGEPREQQRNGVRADAHDGSAAAADDGATETGRAHRARSRTSPTRICIGARVAVPAAVGQPVHHLGRARSRGGRRGARDDRDDAARRPGRPPLPRHRLPAASRPSAPRRRATAWSSSCPTRTVRPSRSTATRPASSRRQKSR